MHAHKHTPNSRLTCSDALTGEQHDARESNAEDGTLAKVEHGQCGCGLQRGRLIGLQEPIVPFCFIFFIVEVLQPGRRKEDGSGTKMRFTIKLNSELREERNKKGCKIW